MSTLAPADAHAGPPVEVAGLRKNFGTKKALKDLTLRLERGQIYGAVGANGGGKTTALHLLAGLLPADAGEGRMLGVDLRKHPARLRSRSGYMTQHHSLSGDHCGGRTAGSGARVPPPASLTLPGMNKRQRHEWLVYALNRPFSWTVLELAGRGACHQRPRDRAPGADRHRLLRFRFPRQLGGARVREVNWAKFM